jgi:hypothetical protein
MCRAKVVEEIKSQILRSINFFPENHAVHAIVRGNKVERDRPHVTISCGGEKM